MSDREIVNFLNDEAKKAVKGSEFSSDEHFFGIAAEIIEEKNREIKRLKRLLK